MSKECFSFIISDYSNILHDRSRLLARISKFLIFKNSVKSTDDQKIVFIYYLRLFEHPARSIETVGAYFQIFNLKKFCLQMIRECFSFIIFDYSNILRDRSRLDTMLARIFKFSKNDRIRGGRLFEGRIEICNCAVLSIQ